MATTTNHATQAEQTATVQTPLPRLEAGDHLDQRTFHERYEAMPEGFRAELIGGIVYMPSPLGIPHGTCDVELCAWFGTYKAATPGVLLAAGATLILADDSEPQPDLMLWISGDSRGRIRIEGGYATGAPELVAEVASSSESYDLYSKKLDYERAGVREYLVVALRQKQVHWFSLRDGKFEALAPGADGIYRSVVFPGLWLDPAALLESNTQRMLEVLQSGLATPEHAAFVATLAATG